MKNYFKILVICFFTLFSVKSFSQENFSSYYSDYLEETYTVKISLEEDKTFSLYIETMSLDRLYTKGGLILEQKKYPELLKSIEKAKIKYEEWVKIAKENNVESLTKPMPYSSIVGSYFLYGSQWHFQFVVNLSFDFVILENNNKIEYLLLVRTGELQSSSNQFITLEGLILVFRSVQEIDDFVSTISLEKIEEFANKPKKTEIFK